MDLQYLQDKNGDTTAVVVPIKQWRKLTERFGDIEELPKWQKDMLDERLEFLRNHPDKMISMEEVMKELDRDDDL